VKRIVITGASGFIGSNLARRLLADGHEVHALLRPGHTHWRIEEIAGQLNLHNVDLLDADDVNRAVRQIRPDWVFHLATYGAYPTQTGLLPAVQTNFLGTLNLAEACRRSGVELMVNTGSSSEYGLKDHAPKEDEGLEPNSSYAVTKAASSLLCGYLARTHHIRIPTLRLYSVYGPYEEPTRLMPTLISTGLEGRFPPMADPDTARDYIHVDDVCQAYLAVAAAPDQEPDAIYNVGTGVQTPLRQVAAVAARTLGLKGEPVWGSLEPRSWDTSVWVADSDRIRRASGWSPRMPFKAGFRAMVDWARNNPVWRARYAGLPVTTA
jgi:nucleoside-diphosphate-sugar epimerase